MASHYLNQWRSDLLTHICATWPQWAKWRLCGTEYECALQRCVKADGNMLGLHKWHIGREGFQESSRKNDNKSDSEQYSRQAMRWRSKWNEYKNSAEGYIHIDPITSLIVPPIGIPHQTFKENSTYFRYQNSKTSVNNNTNRPSKWYVRDKHPTRHKMAWVTYMPSWWLDPQCFCSV